MVRSRWDMESQVQVESLQQLRQVFWSGNYLSVVRNKVTSKVDEDIESVTAQPGRLFRQASKWSNRR